jgi:hypothetical protein
MQNAAASVVTELLPGVVAAAPVAIQLRADLKRCATKFERAAEGIDCCRRCNPFDCEPCRVRGEDSEISQYSEKYKDCVCRSWQRALTRTFGPGSTQAILASLEDAGLEERR